MGVPPSQFHLLADLANDEPAARKAVREFILFVVIVYDPKTNPHFAHWLADQFASLDLFSGPRLLFFAPVDPGEAWLRFPGVLERPYMTYRAEQASSPDLRRAGQLYHLHDVNHFSSVTTTTLPHRLSFSVLRQR